MNERQALYISTIAQEGGILAAAKKLHISQPSLSQMLKQVETELGVQLFDRSSQPLRLTCAGERYLHAAAVILNANETLAAELREIRQEERGRLRLGISMQRGAQLLPRVLPEFFAAWPYVELELMEAGSTNLEALLGENRIDLALASTAPSDASFDYELLQHETFGILAGGDSELARTLPSGTPIKLPRVENAPFIVLKRGHNSRTIQDAVFLAQGLCPHVLLETDSMETAVRVTLESECCMLCADWHADGRGHFYPLKDYRSGRHFYAVTRRGQSSARYTRDLVDRVRDALSGGMVQM